MHGAERLPTPAAYHRACVKRNQLQPPPSSVSARAAPFPRPSPLPAGEEPLFFDGQYLDNRQFLLIIVSATVLWPVHVAPHDYTRV